MSIKNFTIETNFGERIRQLRETLKMTQATFAEKIGITGSYKTKAVVISRWERGERKPDSIYLTRMAIAFKVGINWLLTGEGEMFVGQGGEGTDPSAPYSIVLTEKERTIIDLLRENPELEGLCLKLLGARQSIKEALEEFQRLSGPNSEPPKS